jgi:hypothetical protein
MDKPESQSFTIGQLPAAFSLMRYFPQNVNHQPAFIAQLEVFLDISPV